jgi:uncharacterized membrane protein
LSHERGHDDEEGAGPSSGQGRGHYDDASSTAADAEPDTGNAVERTGPPGVGAGGELDSVRDEVKPEVVDAVTARVRRERAIASWRGPLPAPSDLQGYEFVVPGSAERILRMAEKALDSQIDADTTLARGDVASVRRGQWQSTGVASLSLICALVLALLGLPWEVVVAFVAPPVFEFGTSLVRAIREPRRGSEGE